MRASPKLLLGVALLLSATACQDPSDPCDRPHACEVQGVDLSISHLEIVASRFDSIDGLGVVDPDLVPVDFEVRNRGDSASLAAVLVLSLHWAASPDSLDIPPLAPGESYGARHTVHTRHILYERTHDDAFAWVTAVLLVVDADTANNQLLSTKVHVAVPVIQIAVTLSPTDITVNVPFHARVIVDNVSRFAALPSVTLGFCVVPVDDQGCLSGDEGFGARVMGSIPPLGRYDQTLSLIVPRDATIQNAARSHQFVTLLLPPGTPDSLVTTRHLWFGAWIGPEFALHPDYHACQPELLRPDTPVTAPIECRKPSPFALFELQARTDLLYTIEQQAYPGAEVYDDTGNFLGLTYPGWHFYFAAAGTKWLADFAGSPDETTRTMTLRQEPRPRAMGGTSDGYPTIEIGPSVHCVRNCGSLRRGH